MKRRFRSLIHFFFFLLPMKDGRFFKTLVHISFFLLKLGAVGGGFIHSGGINTDFEIAMTLRER